MEPEPVLPLDKDPPPRISVHAGAFRSTTYELCQSHTSKVHAEDRAEGAQGSGVSQLCQLPALTGSLNL